MFIFNSVAYELFAFVCLFILFINNFFMYGIKVSNVLIKFKFMF